MWYKMQLQKNIYIGSGLQVVSRSLCHNVLTLILMEVKGQYHFQHT